MKVMSAKVQNFSSYKQLDFEFDSKGLALVAGPTGSGKSTLCDVISWILFGRTAKGGNADEVLSWGTDEVTKGTLYLQNVTVSRSRGPKAKDNDLMFWPVDGVVTRGKDINDTQQLINSLIGMDFNLYLSGAYFHEFSQTAQFFTTTAKVRRQITEQIVDLSLAKNLTERMSEEKKELKKQITETTSELSKLNYHLSYLKKELAIKKEKSDNWDGDQTTKIFKTVELEQNYKNHQQKVYDKTLTKFYERQLELESEMDTITRDIENAKMQIQQIKHGIEVKKSKETKSENCPTCDRPLHTIVMNTILDEFELKTKDSLLTQKLVVLESINRNYYKHLETKPVEIVNAINPYSRQVEDLTGETNPHEDSVLGLKKDINNSLSGIDKLDYHLGNYKEEFDDLELLLQVTDDFRGALVKNTITELETNTNKIISDYFDGEIRIAFEIQDADKLEVSIFKDGNQAQFTQLSKGQRQLLKLSFGISVMRAAANHHGLSFNCAFLDEALDGLDENLKIKAFSLLESLSTEYSSVFVVEHSSELKNLFTNKYEVALVNGHSEIEEQ